MLSSYAMPGRGAFQPNEQGQELHVPVSGLSVVTTLIYQGSLKHMNSGLYLQNLQMHSPPPPPLLKKNG